MKLAVPDYVVLIVEDLDRASEVIKKILEYLSLWEESHAPPNRNPEKKRLLLTPRIPS